VRAVNLIPRDARRGGVAPSLASLGPAHFLIALLVIAVAFMTLYVLTSNTVSQRRAQLASVHQQLSHVQTEVTQLQRYEQFEKLAQERASTVRELAATRFDWHGALADLSKVVPSDTSLQSLVATVSPSSGASSGNVRSDINAPAFELKGCTGSQDDVAQLMSRLRLINGVTRVTLEDSTANGAGGGAGSVSSAGGCPANGPSFDMVVFFSPLPGSSTSTVTTGAAK